MQNGQENALLILRQGEATQEWSLHDFMVIGRDDECDISLPDRTVSRRHATLRRTAKGFALTDEASKNGTWLNGAPLDGTAFLRDGDEISIAARYKLFFVDAEATAPLLFEARGLRLDPETVMVYVNGLPLDPPLSGPQFELLRLLVAADGTVVTRDDIVTKVWAADHAEGVSEDAVDALVRRLRLRLAEADPDWNYIVTVRGYGFRLEAP